MDNLENLFQEQKVLKDLMKRNNEDIMNEQIIKKEYLTMILGFKLIAEIDNLATYEKTIRNGSKYLLMLDYSKPNIIGLEKNDSGRIYGFHIQEVDDFINLLYFINII